MSTGGAEVCSAAFEERSVAPERCDVLPESSLLEHRLMGKKPFFFPSNKERVVLSGVSEMSEHLPACFDFILKTTSDAIARGTPEGVFGHVETCPRWSYDSIEFKHMLLNRF